MLYIGIVCKRVQMQLQCLPFLSYSLCSVLADQVHPVMAIYYVEMPNIPRQKTLSLPVMLPYWIIQDRTQD